MEALYAKLYDKYSKLKKEKESQLDELNRDQEKKFLNFATVADEMIEYLKSENGKLHGQVDELKSELASIRSVHEEQQFQYEKLLEEENEKNKDLSERISRLQKLEHNECSLCAVHEETRSGQGNFHENTSPESVPSESETRSTKKRKYAHDREDAATSYFHAEHEHPADEGVNRKKSKIAPNIPQPACCQRKMNNSAGDSTDTSSVNCMFQHLIEFLIGMKIAPNPQSNEPCLLAHHQSSGYSFSLTWIANSHGETELLYRLLSLGTFERVAPEWMKDTLIFSTYMSRIFFERLSRVIKS